MKYTNELNIPEPIAKAVMRHPYTKGPADFSVTELIGPPQIRVLRRKHDDELTVDVSDQIYSLTGSIGHAIIERAGPDSGICERRFYHRMSDHKGRDATVSGQVDLILDKDEVACDVKDYKFTSIWTAKDGKPKPEWTQQLNAYRFLIERGSWLPGGKGEEFVRSCLMVRSAEIIAIFRDWSKRKVGSEDNYPAHQIMRLPIALWDIGESEAWLRDRITLHLDAHEAAAKGEHVVECTDEEVWARPAKFAVMSKGKKRAVKLFDRGEDGLAFIDTMGGPTKGYYLEKRPGEYIRCQDYCDVADFCPQHKRRLAEPTE